MKSVVLNDKELENLKKSNVIKSLMLGSATPIGLLLSGVLAYINIDFTELLGIFRRNIFDPERVNELMQVMKKWYHISFAIFIAAILMLILYSIRNKRKIQDVLTWRQTIFFAIDLILLCQVVLPLYTATVVIVIMLLYFVFFSSMLLKNIIGYAAYLFAVIIGTVCTSSGIELTYGSFIGKENYSNFLTMITSLISTPYIVTFLLRLIIKLIQKVTGNDLVTSFFKPVEVLFSINVLRYTLYILLFFTSIFTYSTNVPQSNCGISLVKEALLEFVVLDTVIYSIISNLNNTKKNRKLQNMRRCYTPIKYDLEFILSAIAMNNMKDKGMSARIKFSIDINTILKENKKKNINDINKLITDISTNYYKMDILEQKIKVVLSRIIELIE